MNKLGLIEKLRNKADLTKNEARKVVDLFLMKCPMHLLMVIGLK